MASTQVQQRQMQQHNPSAAPPSYGASMLQSIASVFTSRSSRRSRARGSRTRTEQVVLPAGDINPPLPSETRPYNGNHSLIAMVVDRSGSMQSMGCEVSGGCNAYLEECLKGDLEDSTTTSVTFTRFDNVVECLHDNVPLASGIRITNADVSPRGSTALYDGIGVTLQRTVQTLETMDFVPKVVVFILTDGQENSSESWSKEDITKQITKLQAEPYNWDFYFAAANQDAMQAGGAIGMDMSSCLSYSASPRAMSSAFKAQAKAHGRRKKGMAKGYTAEERNDCLD